MTAPNTTAIKFLISPNLVALLILIIFFVAFSIAEFPIKVVWQEYVPNIVMFCTLGIFAFLFHPPILAKILSERRMNRLSAVYQLRDILLAFIMFFLFLMFLQPLVHIVYIWSGHLPYADDVLHQLDSRLGLDWFAYFQWVHDHPRVIPVLDIAYKSMNIVVPATLALLMLFNKPKRAFVLIHGFLATAIACVAIGAFFPALGATAYLIEDLSLFPNFQSLPGSYAVASIENLRTASQEIYLAPSDMPGLITFPSFHTAGTIAIAYAFRRTPLEIPMWIYAMVVIASTPVFGGHYLVDVLAGSVIGFGVCIAIERWMYIRSATYFLAKSIPEGRHYSSPATT